MSDNVKALFLRDLTNSERAFRKKKSVNNPKKYILRFQSRLTVRFKRVRDIDGVALLVSHCRAIDVPLADLYRAAVHDDRRAVVSHRGHGTARHVLVASGQGYVTIVVLGLANKTQNDEKHQRLPEAQVTLLIVVPL